VVLSDRTIKEELAKGRIVIRPLDPQDIQPASVDIHLDNKFQVFLYWRHPHVIDLSVPLDGLTQMVTVKQGSYFSLQPGQFILGSIKEYIEVPNDLMARLEGKSSLGRVGLLIHATAGYVDPGWKGHLTLELSNASPLPIMLYPGMKISQISFHRLTTPADRPYGSPGLKSKYQGQILPTGTRSHHDFHQAKMLSPIFPASHPAQRRPRDHRLRQWLRESEEFQGSIRYLAETIQVPLKTAEDWVYKGAMPREANRVKLYQITGLSQFKIASAQGQQGLLPQSDV